MALPTSSLAKICNAIRGHVDTLGEAQKPADWNVNVTIGAPGANLAASNTSNSLNLFFYRFEPFTFDAAAQPGDVQWIKVFCVITAFGVDEDTDNNDEVDMSAGFNELRMLSQVMRLFQETPVMLIDGDNPGEVWHVQYVPRPLADEQINQIWSTQGDTIYRPSVVYEIALAPVEPLKPSPQSARVASFGVDVDSNLDNSEGPLATVPDPVYPPVPSITIDTANPHWAPAIVFVTGPAGDREATLSLNLDIPVGVDSNADFSNFPGLDIWIAGDTNQVQDLSLVGELLQNPDADASGGRWAMITAVEDRSADTSTLDMDMLPEPFPDPGATGFRLTQVHWTGIDNSNNSWQLQLFVERFIQYDAESGEWVNAPTGANDGLRIRSNPLLVTLTREAP